MKPMHECAEDYAREVLVPIAKRGSSQALTEYLLMSLLDGEIPEWIDMHITDLIELGELDEGVNRMEFFCAALKYFFNYPLDEWE